jgi:hypothetical protein
MDAQLRDPDQRGIVRIRVRGDGTMTPQDIRFCPLTAKERAARDREITTPAALPIMIEP